MKLFQFCTTSRTFTCYGPIRQRTIIEKAKTEFRTSVGGAALLLSLLVSSLFFASQTYAQDEASLYHWYHSGLKDNFTTTDPRWAGSVGDTKPVGGGSGYRMIRYEGKIFSPDALQPLDTTPVWSWFSRSNLDNFLSTDPRWDGDVGDIRPVGGGGGYRMIRKEGYAFLRPFAGTTPLYSWYSPRHRENYATTHSAWVEGPGDTRSPDYRFVRLEGYVKDGENEDNRANAHIFGYQSRPVSGTRPLLVVLVDYPDQSLQTSTATFQTLFFGAGHPNVSSHFAAMSNNRFRWSRADLIRILYPVSITVATRDPGIDADILRQVANEGFDFSRYDTNRNGKVSREELGVIVINPTYMSAGGGWTYGGAQTRNVSVNVSGKQFDRDASFCDENGDINLFTHELIHQLGFAQHIYGPRASRNSKASVFAASFLRTRHTCCGFNQSPGPIQLDPWHKMLMGWLRPRIFRISKAAKSVTIEAAEPRSNSSLSPVILYDPKQGTDEFFILEYRTPSSPRTRNGGYDAGVSDQGIAVWYVKKKSDHQLVEFNWPPPILRPYNPALGNHMYADYLLTPSGPGGNTFWTSRHREFPLSWGDDRDSGLRLKVGPMSSGSHHLTVQWRHSEQPYLVRIDSVRPSRFSATSSNLILSLEGMFPISTDGLFLKLINHTREYRLNLVTISPTKLTARIPGSIDRGTYSLYFHSARAGENSSNGYVVRVD